MFIFSDRGHVYACGDNKMGQCGTGSTAPIIDKAARVSQFFVYKL